MKKSNPKQIQKLNQIEIGHSNRSKVMAPFLRGGRKKEEENCAYGNQWVAVAKMNYW